MLNLCATGDGKAPFFFFKPHSGSDQEVSEASEMATKIKYKSKSLTYIVESIIVSLTVALMGLNL